MMRAVLSANILSADEGLALLIHPATRGFTGRAFIGTFAGNGFALIGFGGGGKATSSAASIALAKTTAETSGLSTARVSIT
jgi:hypothetical protein